ncbi:MAG: RNA-processing protein [Desulfurococcaceae archaeon]|jgi:ribosomal RNA assembly protein|nr:KH domain-containing protein [Desulfurococcales archaeon]MCI4456700.1 RNA-processing protein [Desulfurococcaceae archaeon]
MSNIDQGSRYIPGVTKIYTKIPVERVGILLSNKGEIIKTIQQRLDVKISIDPSLGSVVIEPSKSDTPVNNLFKAKDYIEAIGYGFSPERAERVLGEDQVLLVIDLKDQLRLPENHLKRIKGRIIGEEGRARRNLEEISGCYISVYENYIAIIGDYESANAVKEAIQLLIEGREHSTVYRYLKRLMLRSSRKPMI